MQANDSSTGQAPAQAAMGDIERAMRNGANWFYWIAGLSMVNSIVAAFGSEVNFVVGLGVTQIIDSLAGVAKDESTGGTPTAVRAVALGLDAVVAAVLVVIGRFANKRHGWAFILGMVLYTFDALIFLAFQMWMNVAFHVFALVGMGKGYSSLKKILAFEAQNGLNDPTVEVFR